MSNPVVSHAPEQYYPYVKWVIQPLSTSGSNVYSVWSNTVGGVEEGDLLIYTSNAYDDGTSSIQGSVNAIPVPTISIGEWSSAGAWSRQQVSGASMIQVNASQGGGSNSASDDSVNLGAIYSVPNTGRRSLDVQITTDMNRGQDVNDQYEYVVCLSMNGDHRPISNYGTVNNVGEFKITFQDQNYANPGTPSASLSFVDRFVQKTAYQSSGSNQAKVKVIGVSSFLTNASANLANVFGVERFNLTTTTWNSAASTFDVSEAISALGSKDLYILRFTGVNATGRPNTVTTTETNMTKIWSRGFSSGLVDGWAFVECFRLNKINVNNSLWTSTLSLGGNAARAILVQSILFTSDR